MVDVRLPAPRTRRLASARRTRSGGPTLLKRAVSRLFYGPVYAGGWLALRIVGRYRILRIEETRAAFAALAREPGPILICANHLTFIDSMLIVWALGSMRWYAGHFARLSWNVPAADVFGQRLAFRIIAALTKCVFVDREGSFRHKERVLRACRDILERGEVVTIFPEGRRSRSGRFEIDKLSAGVGKLVAEVPGCRVLCLHLRADKQSGHSDYPPRGAVFEFRMKLLTFDQPQGGRRGWREVTSQIGQAIAGLEADHFRARDQDHG